MDRMGVNIRRVRMNSRRACKTKQASKDWEYKRFYFHGIENSVNEALAPFTPLPGLRDFTFDY